MTTKFYHDVKKYISPSALALWHDSKVTFKKNYFINSGTKLETQAMRMGTFVHSMIEIGSLDVEKKFEKNEQELSHTVGGFNVYGRPDSYGITEQGIEFVDYKTYGAELFWDTEKLKGDIKMLCTAWLVWQQLGRRGHVTAHIEAIPVDARTSEILDEPHTVFTVVYSEKQLSDFGMFILKSIEEINEAYREYVSGVAVVSEEFARRYQTLLTKKQSLTTELAICEQELEEYSQQLLDVMKDTIHVDVGFGHFIKSAKETYNYPDTVEVVTDFGAFRLKQLEEVLAGLRSARSRAVKFYRMNNEPDEVVEHITFHEN